MCKSWKWRAGLFEADRQVCQPGARIVRIEGGDVLLPEVHLKLAQQADLQPRHPMLLGLTLKQHSSPHL